MNTLNKKALQLRATFITEFPELQVYLKDKRFCGVFNAGIEKLEREPDNKFTHASLMLLTICYRLAGWEGVTAFVEKRKVNTEKVLNLHLYEQLNNL